jgi:hypothetical protein
MKIWEKIKFCLYIISCILILVFHHFSLEHVHFVVGTVMLAYAIENMAIKQDHLGYLVYLT